MHEHVVGFLCPPPPSTPTKVLWAAVSPPPSPHNSSLSVGKQLHCPQWNGSRLSVAWSGTWDRRGGQRDSQCTAVLSSHRTVRLAICARRPGIDGMTLTASTTVTMKSFQGTCGYLYNCPPFEAASEDCPPADKNSNLHPRAELVRKSSPLMLKLVPVYHLLGWCLDQLGWTSRRGFTGVSRQPFLFVSLSA